MRRAIGILAWAVVVTVPFGCAQEKGAKSQSASAESHEPAPQPVTERGTLRGIRLPEATVELPAGKGRETVAVQCGVCHSLAYIPLQPPLSRDGWTASVTKMQKTYSAPIPDEKVPEIIDYLVAVNGKQ